MDVQREKSKSLKKAQSLIIQNEDVKEIFQEDAEVMISDEELKQLASAEAKDETEDLLHTEIIPISLSQYWKNFLETGCAFPLKEFIEEHKKDFEFH